MPITFQKTLKSKIGSSDDSPFVSSSIQINVDAAKSGSYPGYGTNWSDISGNGYNYTLVGDVTFDNTNSGSLNFANNSYADSPNFGSTFFEDFTYEVWINPTTNSGVILNEVDGGGWTVSLMELVDGVIKIGCWVGGTAYIGIGAINTGNWYQVVMKYSATGHTLSGYVNGQLINSSSDFYKQHPSSNYYITLAHSQPTSFGNGGYYNGKLSSIKFYNRVLTDEEILQNYNALRYRYEPNITTNFESRVTITPKPPTNDGTTAQRAGESAYQIKRDFPSSTDGLYWIKNDNINGGTPFQIYADMTTNGGGWTLLLLNNYSNWDYTNALLRNQLNPPASPNDRPIQQQGANGSDNYSIVQWADYIKSSASGFEYMIDASSRGNWGGIWRANGNYSFVNTDNTQTDITLVVRFGNWNYNDVGIEQHMPWYSGNNCGVLTTSNSPSDQWWGSLVSQCGFEPTPWLGNENPNPGILWYWVR